MSKWLRAPIAVVPVVLKIAMAMIPVNAVMDPVRFQTNPRAPVARAAERDIGKMRTDLRPAPRATVSVIPKITKV